jgi:hypothetical protein
VTAFIQSEDPDDRLCVFARTTFRSNVNSSGHNLFRDFLTPALTHALRLDRGVGYFAPGCLRLAGQGIPRARSRLLGLLFAFFG